MARTRPGFGRFTLWQKCGLIAAPFLVPIAALLYLVFAQNNENIGVATAELRGQQFLKPLKDVGHHLGQHRALAARALNGDAAAKAEMSRTAALVDAAVADADAADAKLGKEFKTDATGRWKKVRDEWAALKMLPGGTTAADSFDRHSAALATLAVLVQDVWEISNLILDPVADTYYLQDTMIANAILGGEEMAKLQAIAAGAAARGGKDAKAFTQREIIDANVQLGKVQQTRETIDKEVLRAVQANATLKGKMELAQADYARTTDAFMAKVRDQLDAKGDAPAAAVHAAGADAAAALSRLYDAYDPLLADLLAARAAGYRRTNYAAALGTLIGLLAVGGVAFVVARGITRQVDGLNAVFARIRQEDYQARAAVQSGDELGQLTEAVNGTLDVTLKLIQSKGEKDDIQTSIMKLLEEVSGVADGDLTKEAEVSADMTGAIADSFNFMIDQLRKIIGNVQSATLQVSTAANQIHASADHLAGGSEDQAEQIVNTSAAIDEMAVSIQQVSENAALSTTVAQQALANARQGNVAVKGTIEGMNRIREQAQETAKRIKRLGETSQEIGQIVQLIDDIADRTSILALNASIQAAAAGDAGRGFAVVAEEVERLAVRSTEATKKIASLVKAIQGETNEAVSAMEKSIQEVVSGSKVANQAGQSLQDIEGVSVKLAELIQSISLASKQQARGSEALAKSMGDISQITQQTASGTKQTAESVNSLARLADDLRSSVSTFRLPPQYQPGGNVPAGIR